MTALYLGLGFLVIGIVLFVWAVILGWKQASRSLADWDK